MTYSGIKQRWLIVESAERQQSEIQELNSRIGPRPLYLFSQFFEDKAIEKLLGAGINSEYLNDDKIGILMDDIYELGLTNLFIEIGLLVIKKFKIDTSYAHLDSTSFLSLIHI